MNQSQTRGSPFSVELCVASKKKQIQLYTATEDRLIHVKDISLAEPAVSISLDGSFVCAAMATQYCMINFESGHVQELFPYDSENNRALINKISQVNSVRLCYIWWTFPSSDTRPIFNQVQICGHIQIIIKKEALFKMSKRH